jgi:hypothetical protein
LILLLFVVFVVVVDVPVVVFVLVFVVVKACAFMILYASYVGKCLLTSRDSISATVAIAAAADTRRPGRRRMVYPEVDGRLVER